MATLQYRPAIDGLRAIAVLCVFVFHLNRSWLPGGFVGVDVFFVISGYLITSIILKDCESGNFSLTRFYQRRIARIFPAFLTVTLFTLIGASCIYSPQDYASAGANFSASVMSVANMKFMLQGNYFEISPDAQPFLHCWSLSVEEQFYLFFPLFFLLVFKFARKRQALILGILALGSLFACIAMTHWRPVWAFYLLPTRGWELLAGCILAVAGTLITPSRTFSWLPVAGLGAIATSVVLLNDGPSFPGWRALLPTVGAVALLLPIAPSGHAEKWMSARPLVFIGRMSYSLYLWHWPIFSLLDYQLILAPEPVRLALKIVLSFVAAALSFQFIETPCRIFLNRPKTRTIAYASLATALVICIPLGISIRRDNYVNATSSDVAKGGLVFPGKPDAPSVVLMGDSNGSMYGKVMKEICSELGQNLTVISVAAGDPLPPIADTSNPLWIDSLAAVSKAKPDYLVLACQWTGKLHGKKDRLVQAIEQLQPFAGHIILLNQPPFLPEIANRASIRSGTRPPFRESTDTRESRFAINALLDHVASPSVSIINVASYFENPADELLFLDDRGHQLYHDASHLSGYGANRIRTMLREALSAPYELAPPELKS